MDEPRTLFFTAAGLLLALAALGAFMEHRRTKRRDVDRPGWVPWNFVQVLAFFLMAGAIVLGLRS